MEMDSRFIKFFKVLFVSKVNEVIRKRLNLFKEVFWNKCLKFLLYFMCNLCILVEIRFFNIVIWGCY